MRLIDADALQAKFIHGRFDDTYISSTQIIEAPTVDAEPVRHGRWVKHYRSGTPVAEGYVSTCCDMWNNRKSDYCPSCGAKMDRGNDNATN